MIKIYTWEILSLALLATGIFLLTKKFRKKTYSDVENASECDVEGHSRGIFPEELDSTINKASKDDSSCEEINADLQDGSNAEEIERKTTVAVETEQAYSGSDETNKENAIEEKVPIPYYKLEIPVFAISIIVLILLLFLPHNVLNGKSCFRRQEYASAIDHLSRCGKEDRVINYLLVRAKKELIRKKQKIQFNKKIKEISQQISEKRWYQANKLVQAMQINGLDPAERISIKNFKDVIKKGIGRLEACKAFEFNNAEIRKLLKMVENMYNSNTDLETGSQLCNKIFANANFLLLKHEKYLYSKEVQKIKSLISSANILKQKIYWKNRRNIALKKWASFKYDSVADMKKTLANLQKNQQQQLGISTCSNAIREINLLLVEYDKSFSNQERLLIRNIKEKYKVLLYKVTCQLKRNQAVKSYHFTTGRIDKLKEIVSTLLNDKSNQDKLFRLCHDGIVHLQKLSHYHFNFLTGQERTEVNSMISFLRGIEKRGWGKRCPMGQPHKISEPELTLIYVAPGFLAKEGQYTYLIKPYWIGKTEITQDQYDEIMDKDPSHFPKFWSGLFTSDDEFPVETISYYEAKEFCRKLTSIERKRNNIPDFLEYRLPTIAEWRYAANGGNAKTRRFCYSGSDSIANVGWYSCNSDRSTHKVSKKKPNVLGVCDMSGNVAEWVLDELSDSHSKARFNPVGKVASPFKPFVMGGSYNSPSKNCTSDSGTPQSPYYKSNSVGFRIVLAFKQ
jgi:hypothetical protein